MSKLIPKHQTPSQPLVLSQDNTRVESPYIESIPITETALYKQYLADPYKNSDFNTWKKRQELIQSNRKDEKVTADNRPSKVKKQESKQGEAIYNYQQRKEQEAKNNKLIWTGIGLGGLALAQATPAAPYIDASFATLSAAQLADQADKGTLGFNAETGLNALGLIPLGIRAIPYIRKYSPIFIPVKNSYTRGIGRGTEGISDLVNTGVVRGNPRGTEVTAHQFAKLWRKNRLHFRDIMKDTGIPNIEQKFFSRTLNKDEFEAIKNAASTYKSTSQSTQPVSLTPISPDPLSEYNSYDDYIKAVQEQINKVEAMTGKIKSGEVKVNTNLQPGEKGFLIGTPIEERFGTNSDYVGDGHPLTYWYSDGRNPFRKGYDYAGSDWAVRVLNADTQIPFMHTYHLHPSFFYTPTLDSPNVQIFRRLPFGFGLRVPKKWVKQKFGNTNNKTISKAIFSDSNTGELLYTPDELVKSGDFAKGKEMAAKFFEHPVVQNSYKHNQELAKRFGITIPDKQAAEVVKQPVQVNYRKLDGNEIAQVSRRYYGDPDTEITMDWGYYPIKDLRQAIIHENLHRGWYSAPLRPQSMTQSYYNNTYKPEYRFWEWKTKKLLDPKYHNDWYLMDIHSGEAGPNFIDLGRDLGLKLGQKYPGYKAVKQMLQNYKGNKSFMIPKLNYSKAGIRHVWDAMTGKYFMIPATIGIGGATITNKYE